MSEWFDGVDGIASGACGVAIFSTASALDDVGTVLRRAYALLRMTSLRQIEFAYFAFRISDSRSGLESSRTRCGYFSPPW